jgi:putative transposase
MSYLHRIQIPGGLYHVTSRGNDRATLYYDEPDYASFMRTLAKVCERYAWGCHAYCVMPNHYHLIVETPEANLAAGMHVLNLSYARWFNWRHAHVGHVFQGPYRDQLITTESHLLEAYRYVALNPVRARLVAGPSEWPWTSYRATAGTEPAPSFLRLERVRSFFAWTKSDGTDEFARFVSAGLIRLELAAGAVREPQLTRRNLTKPDFVRLST